MNHQKTIMILNPHSKQNHEASLEALVITEVNMINQSTIDKLVEMRLTSMADAFRIQLNDTTMKDVPFAWILGLT